MGVHTVTSPGDSPAVGQSTKRKPKPEDHVDHRARVALSFEIERISHWPEAVKRHLARQPHCVCCKPNGRRLGPVQVHHIFPFHYCMALGRPDLELDERNLITLCGKSHDGIGENHHLWIGHLDNFQSSNLSVVRDAKKTFFGTRADDVKNDKRWLRRRKRRLEPLETMDVEERAALVALMDRRMPRCEGRIVYVGQMSSETGRSSFLP
jgi:hypothetical protein